MSPLHRLDSHRCTFVSLVLRGELAARIVALEVSIYLRITWALGTAQVFALLALGSLANKQCLTQVTCPAHPLCWSSPRHFLPSRAVWHSKRIVILVVRYIARNDCSNGNTFIL